MHFDLMKNNMAALNNERVVQIDFIFLSVVLTRESIFCSNPELKFLYWIPNLVQSLFSFSGLTYHSANFFLFYLFLCDWGDQAS